jgi:site-specific recombinase XerD
MYTAGLRRAEVVALDLADCRAESKQLVVRGKGRKERKAHLIEGASAALLDWLEARGPSTGPLFWPVNKGDNLVKRQLTTQAVYNLLRKRAREAGITKASPHDLRRTFVGDLLDKGVDISTVARMAGHANVQTTARYDRRPQEAQRKAAEKLHLPYERRGKRA